MKVYTAEDIADLLGVATKKVIGWMESKSLKGYKLPGKGQDRVLPHDLFEFLVQQNIPIPDALQNQPKQEKVLIIDDDEAIARVIQRIVTQLKLKSEIALDGFEAGHKVHSFNPSLLLLDLQMPGINGFKIIEKLKSSEKFKHIKIIVVSGSEETELNKASKLGADACIRKPFVHEELQQLIKEWLR